jgi:magnesium chelatase family protein
MLARVHSVGVFGIDAYAVEVEVYATKAQLPRMTVVGLPDASVKESSDRVIAALQNSGFHVPPRAVTVNLAPADRRKEGPAFELPIALGLARAVEAYEPAIEGPYTIVGELALDGRVRPVRGCLSMALHCRSQGVKGMIVPADNAAEAAVVQGLDIVPVKHLMEAVGFLAGKLRIEPVRVDIGKVFQSANQYDVDFSEVRGQEMAKRALEVAAAGGHNVLMIGPPGVGKSMLAQRLCSILPPLSVEEALETTRIFSVSGLLEPGKSLMTVRPFRAPHHSVSEAGLVGGGTHPKPGEISMAHHGVLFLDELPEFARGALEALRQPLEDGRATISRATISVTYPCQFMLVAAMNPCKCGNLGHPRRECRCSPAEIQHYRARISGPLLDRIDIHTDVAAVEYHELTAERAGEPSAAIRARVEAARQRQLERFAGESFFCNARMQMRHIRRFCRLDSDGQALMKQAMDALGLSARAYTKILKLARTIADLEGREHIQHHHVTEAIGYRTLDRTLE